MTAMSMATLARQLGIFFFVGVFSLTALFVFPSVQDFDASPWQAVLLDEDETDPVEPKTVLALPDGQALPSSGTTLTPFPPVLSADRSAAFVLVVNPGHAPSSPRAPPSA
jgi:hypothetical protein